MANQSLTNKLDRFPPFLAYAVAKVRPRNRTLTRIGQKLSWAGVRVGQVDEFLNACKVSLHELHKHRKFLQKHKGLDHLTEPQRKAFKRACAKLLLVKNSNEA
jgi:hypothetical protein